MAILGLRASHGFVRLGYKMKGYLAEENVGSVADILL